MGRVGWTSRLPGYPRRLVPRDEGRREGAPERALTNLDNDRPQWLADALAVLDAAVAVPCGWPSDITDDAVRELLELNGVGT